MQFDKGHSFVKNKALKMTLVSYSSIPGVPTSERGFFIHFFFDYWKIPQKYTIFQNDKFLQNFLSILRKKTPLCH